MSETSTKPTGIFRLVTPCSACPFRTDVAFYLRPDRAQEIADNVIAGKTFYCHKTTEADEDGFESEIVESSAACAGALATMERQQIYPQDIRMAMSMGMYDPDKIKTDAPVYDSLSEWVASYREPTTLEHCEVAGPDCEDPMGFSTGAGAVHSNAEPQTDPDSCCVSCGYVMCPSCISEIGEPGEGSLCVFCVE